MDQPAIDYTGLDYDSLREAMHALARESLPEWAPDDNDLGALLLDAFAWACDLTLYYQSRIAQNLFPGTSDEPDALVQLLRHIGYEIRPPAPATANLRLAFDATEPTPILIPAGTGFVAETRAGERLSFETERDFEIQANQLTPPDAAGTRAFFPLPVVEGKTVTNEPRAISDGSPNQLYTLRERPVSPGSIRIRVQEPGGLTTWTEVRTLAQSGPADRHFAVQRDASGGATVLFGDGVNGLRPPAGTAVAPVYVQTTYRVGGGSRGNLPADTAFRPSLANVRDARAVEAASGGTEGEDIRAARLFAPRLYRTQDRAVTAGDYTDLALEVPGVGKARAVSLGWNQVLLYVAPSGRVAEPSELLVRDLLAHFEARRMTTTSVKVVAPTPADVYLRARIQAEAYYRQSDVRAAAEAAVAAYLDFDAIDFGQPIYLSRIYDAIQSLDQVASVNVGEFSRTPGGGVVASGVIEVGTNELPRPGYRDNPNHPPVPGDPTQRPPIVLEIQGGVEG